MWESTRSEENSRTGLFEYKHPNMWRSRRCGGFSFNSSRTHTIYSTPTPRLCYCFLRRRGGNPFLAVMHSSLDEAGDARNDILNFRKKASNTSPNSRIELRFQQQVSVNCWGLFRTFILFAPVTQWRCLRTLC
jgi:hypothetical protein